MCDVLNTRGGPEATNSILRGYGYEGIEHRTDVQAHILLKTGSPDAIRDRPPASEPVGGDSAPPEAVGEKSRKVESPATEYG